MSYTPHGQDLYPAQGELLDSIDRLDEVLRARVREGDSTWSKDTLDECVEMTKILVAGLGTTLYGLVSSGKDLDVFKANIEKDAKTRMNALVEIFDEYPEIVESYLGRVSPEFLIKRRKAAQAREIGVKRPEPEKLSDLLLAPPKEFSRSVEKLDEDLEKLINMLDKSADASSASSDTIAQAEFGKVLEMQAEELERAIDQVDIGNLINKIVNAAKIDESTLKPIAKDIGDKFAGLFRPEALDFGVRKLADMIAEEFAVLSVPALAPQFKKLSAYREVVELRRNELSKLLGPDGEYDKLLETIEETGVDEAKLGQLATIEETIRDLGQRLSSDVKAYEEQRSMLGKQVDRAAVQQQEILKRREFDIGEIGRTYGEGLRTGKGLFAGAAAPVDRELETGIRSIFKLTQGQIEHIIGGVTVKEFEKLSNKQIYLQENVQGLREKLADAEKDGLVSLAAALKTALSDTNIELESTTNELNGLAGAANNTKDSASELISALELIPSIFSDLSRAELERTQSLEANLTKGLRGFAGELPLVQNFEELSTQQRLFTQMNDVYKRSTASFMDLTRVLPRSLEKIQELRERAFALSTGGPKDKVRSDELTAEADKRAAALNKVTERMRQFAEVNTQMVKFADGLYKVRDALRETAVEQTAQSLKGMREYRKGLENLFGGPGALAPQMVTPAEERAMAMAGQAVRPFETTAAQLRESQIRSRLITERPQGAELMRLQQELMDLPETMRREELGREQQLEVQRIQQQLQPLEASITDLTRAIMTPGVSTAVRERAAGVRQNIIDVLGKATKTISADQARAIINANEKLYTKAGLKEALEGVPEGRQFRGIFPHEMSRLFGSQMTDLMNQIFKQAPSQDILQMREGIAFPITDKLDISNIYLKAIAEATLGNVEEVKALSRKIEEQKKLQAEGVESIKASPVRQDIVPGQVPATAAAGVLEKYLKERTGVIAPKLKEYREEKARIEVSERLRSTVEPGAFGKFPLSRPSLIEPTPFKPITGTFKPPIGEPIGAPIGQLISAEEISKGIRELALAEAKSEARAAVRDLRDTLLKQLRDEVRSRRAPKTAPELAYGGLFETGFGTNIVSGPGGPTGDKIPARLSDGEFVIRTAAAKEFGYGKLEHLNKYGALPMMLKGGGGAGSAASDEAYDAEFKKRWEKTLKGGFKRSDKTTWEQIKEWFDGLMGPSLADTITRELKKQKGETKRKRNGGVIPGFLFGGKKKKAKAFELTEDTVITPGNWEQIMKSADLAQLTDPQADALETFSRLADASPEVQQKIQEKMKEFMNASGAIHGLKQTNLNAIIKELGLASGGRVNIPGFFFGGKKKKAKKFELTEDTVITPGNWKQIMDTADLGALTDPQNDALETFSRLSDATPEVQQKVEEFMNAQGAIEGLKQTRLNAIIKELGLATGGRVRGFQEGGQVRRGELFTTPSAKMAGKYGSDVMRIKQIYDRAKYVVDNKDLLTKGLTGEDKQKKENMFDVYFQDAEKLLLHAAQGKSSFDESFIKRYNKLDRVRRSAIDPELHKIRKQKIGAFTGVKDPYSVFQKSTHLFSLYQDSLRKGRLKKDSPEALELQKYFNSLTGTGGAVKARSIAGFDFKAESTKNAAKIALESITGAKRAFDTQSEETNWKIFLEKYLKSQTSTGSKPVKHHGGSIPTTGHYFMQKGETVYPKGFALGGEVGANETALASPTININVEEIGAQLVEQLSDITLKVDDTPLPVDTTIPVPVDTTTPVAIDTTAFDAAAVRLSSSIETALSKEINATVTVNNTGANAVGADKLDSLEETLNNINNNVFNVKRELEDKISIIDTKAEESVKETDLDTAITNKVSSITANMQTEINNVRTEVSSARTESRSLNHRIDGNLQEIQRRVDMSMNILNT